MSSKITYQDWKKPHVMVDLETLALFVNAIILSIGAVRFNPRALSADDLILEGFYTNVDTDSCRAAGLESDQGTVEWWAAQREEAKSVFSSPSPVVLSTALDQFDDFLKKISDGDPGSVNIWCKGGSFDFAILRNAYQKLGRRVPWNFRLEHDARTAMSYGYLLAEYELPRLEGIPHFAYDDAVHQARMVWDCTQLIRQGA